MNKGSIEVLELSQIKAEANLAIAREIPRRAKIKEAIDNPNHQRDSLLVDGDRFVGYGYYFVFEDERFVLRKINFDCKKTEVMKSFYYKKPTIKDDIFNPQEEWENKERLNYYPLAIVKKAYRGPNHYHIESDALFCAVYADGEWQTRFFPKNNISIFAWTNAVKILT